MMSRILAWFIVAVFILIAFSPMAKAQEDDKTTSFSLSLTPGMSDSTSNIVNMGDETTMRYEKDIVFASLPANTEGKYSGPFVESSLFQFSHSNGFFQFSSNFTMDSSLIMNGVTVFWLRVPIIPSEYQAWRVWCDWGYADSVEGIGHAPDEEWNALLPWLDPSLDYYMGLDNPGLLYDPGNVWSTNHTRTYQMNATDTGLYIRYDGIFPPNQQFNIVFTGILNADTMPSVFLTQERQNLSVLQKFRFFDIFQTRSGSGSTLDYGFRYDYNQSITLDPAWAFVFTQGMGKDGMTAFKLKFLPDNNDYLQWGGTPYRVNYVTNRIHTFVQDSYFSFYMPFDVTRYNWQSDWIVSSTIDWEVTLDLSHSTSLAYFIINLPVVPGLIGDNDTQTITFDITTTTSFILFSSPFFIHDFEEEGSPDYQDINVILKPKWACDLTLLGADYAEEHDAPYPYDMDTHWAYYLHENETAKWNASIPVNAHVYPLFSAQFFTAGRYASVTPTKTHYIYDFGWGYGYNYPGESAIYMFFNNGGVLFWNGSYADFHKSLKDPNFIDDSVASLRELWNKIKNFVGDVAGILWDGINTIWNAITSLGKWIWNTVSEIIAKIISVAKDIAGKVTNIVEGMLYGLPILVILFAVNYVGEALYKGHIPKATKERRLLKKLMPGSIMKRRARYQRKLKIPVIDLKKEFAQGRHLEAERTRSIARTKAEAQRRAIRIQRDKPHPHRESDYERVTRTATENRMRLRNAREYRYGNRGR